MCIYTVVTMSDHALASTVFVILNLARSLLLLHRFFVSFLLAPLHGLITINYN